MRYARDSVSHLYQDQTDSSRPKEVQQEMLAEKGDCHP